VGDAVRVVKAKVDLYHPDEHQFRELRTERIEGIKQNRWKRRTVWT
jgi:hypothetical protein